MSGLVSQLPVRVLGLGAQVWGLYLHLLSLGLRTLLFCLRLLLRVLYVCVQKAGRVVITSAHSMALVVQVCSMYMFLQGLAWPAQLVGSWVALHMQLCCVLLETLRHMPLLPLCAQAAQWLVRVGMRAGRSLSQVRAVVIFIQLCAHTFFLGVCLCMHTCFAAISSKVQVRVHAPYQVSLPFWVYAAWNLGIKVRLWDWGHGKGKGEGIPQGQIQWEQMPQMSRSPEPRRRREVSPSRSQLSPVVPSAATLIIVVCVGFLVLMVVLGLVRIHSLHRRVSGAGSPQVSTDPKDADLFWDDSALTIIVNPMESYQNRQTCAAGAAGGHQEDEDSSDSEAADSPSSDERRIIETPPHHY